LFQAQDEEELDPKIIEFPLSATVEEGHSIKFQCVVDGSDPISSKDFYFFFLVYQLVILFLS
jgi:hypothetical protein